MHLKHVLAFYKFTLTLFKFISTNNLTVLSDYIIKLEAYSLLEGVAGTESSDTVNVFVRTSSQAENSARGPLTGGVTVCPIPIAFQLQDHGGSYLGPTLIVIWRQIFVCSPTWRQ